MLGSGWALTGMGLRTHVRLLEEGFVGDIVGATAANGLACNGWSQLRKSVRAHRIHRRRPEQQWPSSACAAHPWGMKRGPPRLPRIALEACARRWPRHSKPDRYANDQG